jgi:uncharacterized protein with HEPN domain
VTSSKPTTRYQDIRHNVAKIKHYLARGGGLDKVLSEQSMAYDAIRMCFLEISEAAVKLGALAELHEPEIPWGAIHGFGNHLRHEARDDKERIRAMSVSAEMAFSERYQDRDGTFLE